MKGLIILPLILFLFTIFIYISFGLSHGTFSAAGCHQDEREALLKLKHGLVDTSNRLASWQDDDSDCCRWQGVICDSLTGHVIELHLRAQSKEEYLDNSNYPFEREVYRNSLFGGKINPSLQNLKHLKYLDLSNNNFGGIHIPRFLGSIKSLRYLDLSRAGFGGLVPHQLGNLSNLQHLDLNSESGYIYTTYVESLNWVSSLGSLKILDLSNVDLSKAIDWLDVMNALPSLVELHLSGCILHQVSPSLPYTNFSSLVTLDLSFNDLGPFVPDWAYGIETLMILNLRVNNFVGEIPIHLLNLTSLRVLDLSANYFNSSIPDWLPGFTHLEFLDLGSNDLKGVIPSAIGNLTALDSLKLSHNTFEGGIPTSFENLCSLRFLDLEEVQLNQEMNKILEILSPCVSLRLEHLILSSNILSGQLTNLLGRFKNLVRLYANGNLISGPIPEALGELKSLKSLSLGDNKLNGSLPIGLGRLEKLEGLNISGNSLRGIISELHFINLTNLVEFDASHNQLILRVHAEWVPPFQYLEVIALRSWDVGPSFPTWIRFLRHLRALDLSNTKISSALPLWFLNISCSLSTLIINLSQYQMHGNIPYIDLTSSYNMGTWLDLSSNHFEGQLPRVSSPDLQLLDLSNNSFSGSLSSFLCANIHHLQATKFLNLGENFLFGEIPADCLMNLQNLIGIKLSNNNVSGEIPQSIGTLSNLEYLDIHDNNIHGQVPLSLQRCNYLRVLNLGENELGGDISTWLTGEGLSQLLILNLRGNKFHGHISKNLCLMTDLQILDLADNNLTGTIPNCINSFSLMSSDQLDREEIPYMFLGFYTYILEYSPSSSIMRKGSMTEYSTTLRYVRSFDLSNNKISGEIPKELTSLRALQSLNLSHNLLTGGIPKDMGAMKSVESLDFSENQLAGAIPQSMSSLTFLSYLNVSNNQLSGEIPSSTQLQSLSSSSFIGNNLCGRPLPNNCSERNPIADTEKERRTEEDESEQMDCFYFYVSIAPGFVVGFWGVMGPLVFNRRWRHLYFQFLNCVWNKVVVWFRVYAVRVVTRN